MIKHADVMYERNVVRKQQLQYVKTAIECLSFGVWFDSSYFEIAFSEYIKRSPKPSLQDVLRLLTLWLNYGDNAAVMTVVHTHALPLPIDTWLTVW